VQPGAGGGVYNLAAQVDAFNTIFANNTAAVDPDFFGVFSTAINNLLLVYDPTLFPADPAKAHDNILGVDPMLGGLKDYGGTTKTRALPSKTPAINTGDNQYAKGSWDQRDIGHPRISPLGGVIDIGAYEVQGRAGAK